MSFFPLIILGSFGMHLLFISQHSNPSLPCTRASAKVIADGKTFTCHQHELLGCRYSQCTFEAAYVSLSAHSSSLIAPLCWLIHRVLLLFTTGGQSLELHLSSANFLACCTFCSSASPADVLNPHLHSSHVWFCSTSECGGDGS